MRIHVDAICDVGCLRANNEDHILLVKEVFTDGIRQSDFQIAENAFLAVADGMGGHKGGEVASRMVLESLHHFSQKQGNDFGIDDFPGRLEQWTQNVHRQLLKEGQDNPSLYGMGTTLAGLCFFDQGGFVFNAGDSRVYVMRNNEIRQLTSDHTLGQLTGFWGPRSKQLVNCVGAIANTRIEIEEVTHLIQPQTVFLICSDGLTDMLTDEEIKAFLQPLDCKLLVAKAKEKGGRDNISVIGVEIFPD